MDWSRGMIKLMVASAATSPSTLATALARSRRALAEFEIGGVSTNIPFHRGIIDNDVFLNARVSTNLLDRVGPAAFVGS